jgi:hypothetical protein
MGEKTGEGASGHHSTSYAKLNRAGLESEARMRTSLYQDSQACPTADTGLNQVTWATVVFVKRNL